MSAEIADELTRLSALRERGIISAKGYESVKSQLLSGKHLKIAEDIDKLYGLLSEKTLTKKEFEKAVSALMFPSSSKSSSVSAPKGKPATTGLVRLGIVVGVLYLLHLAINLNQESTQGNQTVSSAAADGGSSVTPGAQSENAQAGPIIPSQEARFVAINSEFRGRYNGSQNDLLKSTLVGERGQKLQPFTQAGSVSNWVGTVYKVDRVSDHWASLSVEVGDEIRVGSGGLLDNPDLMVAGLLDQTGKTLGSSEKITGDNGSFIDINSDMGQTLLRLEVGQTVVFSGYFYPADGGGLVDTNLLSENSIASPLYKFKFERILPK